MNLNKSLEEWRNETELANSGVGGQILFATDDFFSPAEAMLSQEDPVWKEEEFTEFGMRGFTEAEKLTRARKVDGRVGNSP